MDINPQSIEKSNQLSWSSDDQGSSHVRSYTCTFCKRGFSNAQALGGHMNIHRKDRARVLNQASNENLLSSDIAKTNPIDLPEISGDKNLSHQLESSEERSCTTFSREDDATPKSKDNVEELQQLPLFVEMPSPSDDKKASSSTGENEEKKMQLSQGSSYQIELDLELRLGPDPHKTSTTNTGELL